MKLKQKSFVLVLAFWLHIYGGMDQAEMGAEQVKTGAGERTICVPSHVSKTGSICWVQEMK